MPSLRHFAGIGTLSLLLFGIAGAGDLAPKGTDLHPFLGHPPAPRGIDDESWLYYDNGIPAYYFYLPDIHDDHYFNVRFTAPDSCKLLQAAFLFYRLPGDTISTLPDLHVLVWPSTGLLPSVDPSEALDSVIIADNSIAYSPNDTTFDTMYVSLAELDLHFGNAVKFHVGWEPDSTDSSDGGLAILADNGIPATNYSCEWWGDDHNTWGTLLSDWGYGKNFCIRVQVETIAPSGQTVWLDPDQPADFALSEPYPNPFNPGTTLRISLSHPQDVSLAAYDLSGRLVDRIAEGTFPAGQNLVEWKPSALASGTYLIVLSNKNETALSRAVLLK